MSATDPIERLGLRRSAPALTLLLLALCGAASAEPAAGPCFQPSDQSAGWKLVALPPSAPALAAPEDVEQFRPEEPVQVLDLDLHHYRGTVDAGLGRQAFEFALPPLSRRLEVDFLRPLRGAKVDVRGWAQGRSYPLLTEERISGATVEVALHVPDLERVELSVHHHLREDPVVLRLRLTQQLVLAADPKLPGALKVGRTLYFRHPGGRTVELCHAPGRRLWVGRKSLDDARPAAVALSPSPGRGP